MITQWEQTGPRLTKGKVTGMVYKPGDYVYPADVEIYYEDNQRKARFKI